MGPSARAGSPLLLAELRHIGGALGRPADNAGALDHLDGDFLMLGLGMKIGPEMGQAVAGALDGLHETMGPGRPRAVTSTLPSAPATSRRSCPPTPADGSAR